MKLLSLVGAFVFVPTISFAQGMQGNLENPVANSTESGIGLVSGWHCTAKKVTVFIDGIPLGESGVGSIRNDTIGVCGHANSGFSLLYNYNKLNPGQHTIEVHADGVLLEQRQFKSVRSGGVPFLSGKSQIASIENFPTQGKSAALEWSQAKQSFVVTGIADTATLDGTYTLARASLQDTYNDIVDSSGSTGLSVSGTMTIAGNKISQNVKVVIDGVTNTVAVNGKFIDYGYYLYDIQTGQQIIVVDRGAALITSYLYHLPDIGWLNEIDYWIKVN